MKQTSLIFQVLFWHLQKNRCNLFSNMHSTKQFYRNIIIHPETRKTLTSVKSKEATSKIKRFKTSKFSHKVVCDSAQNSPKKAKNSSS